jgi:hypothetical protein
MSRVALVTGGSGFENFRLQSRRRLSRQGRRAQKFKEGTGVP